MPLPSPDTSATIFRAQLAAAGLVGSAYTTSAGAQVDPLLLMCRGLGQVWSSTLAQAIASTVWRSSGIPSVAAPTPGPSIPVSPASMTVAVAAALATTIGVSSMVASGNQLVGAYGARMPEAIRLGALMALQSVGLQVTSPSLALFTGGFFNSFFQIPTPAALVPTLLSVWNSTPGLEDAAGNPLRATAARVMLEASLLPLGEVRATIAPANPPPASAAVSPNLVLIGAVTTVV